MITIRIEATAMVLEKEDGTVVKLEIGDAGITTTAKRVELVIVDENLVITTPFELPEVA